MTKFSTISFTVGDLIKLLGFAGMLATMYVNLVIKIEEGNSKYALLEYRVMSLESKTKVVLNKNDDNKLVLNEPSHYALIPKETRFRYKLK